MTEYVNQLGGDIPRTGTLPVGSDAVVWSLDTTLAVIGDHRIDEAAALLDAAERDRLARLLRPHDRRSYLASHIGLRVLLGAYLGLAPEKVTLVREDCPCCGGPHGRPAVAGGAVHFSLSHSADMAYFAFAGVPVGVDVEGLPNAGAVGDVMGTLHPAETAELTALPVTDRQAALARLWSRKEAYLKATGTGLALGLIEPYVGSAATPAPVPGWSLRDLPAPPAYAAALAVRTP
ncbi:4'-phosphopantetheinyl transferase family protein [Streptomyces sp. NPDC054904]|uniref:4'-phosphopantetheinyl transferase family protein n=1 Tax=unclassified Streptomyces TaxID=2593676 RepID=UPI002481EA74|nr:MULTISPECIES: 4'-phosphopantetheinyl transferase superfamily protein [unclassified Streptomyces]MDA5280858.1 4'-phosphopantetheinyl transferase superfamily protein [Streptomyces sp. Isolate_45]MDX2396324.1 4'-phosphopantetheinyl transferase superfamily protein [Streptomyces sp. DK15]